MNKKQFYKQQYQLDIMNRMIKKIIKNQKGGTILMITVLVLSSILMITLVVNDVSRSNVVMSWEQFHSAKAFYAAEAGAEKMMWNIRKNNLDPGVGDAADFCPDPSSKFCFNALVDGDINDCVASIGVCGIESAQKLSNDAIYSISFEYAAPTTTLLSLGSFGEINRVIELRY